MGFRFSKSVRILPGVRLNLSRTGVSASIGRPGATVNLSKRGVRGTVGAPGSGLSYSKNIVTRRPRRRRTSTEVDAAPAGQGGLLERLLDRLLSR